MPLLKRLWNVVRARHLNREIQQELETHLALLEEEEQALGRTPSEARAAARKRFGNAALASEKTRDADLAGWLEGAKRDLFYAARVLRKSPGFSVFAALAIALGIGSTTLMFSIVNSLLLKPLPYPESQRLFMLWQRIPQEERVSLSTREFTAWRQQTGSFETLAAFTGSGFTITGQGEPVQVNGQMVTPSLFNALGIAPILGRAFLASEGEAGRDREVLLSDALWRSTFGGRSDIVGHAVTMNGSVYTIVGVMPPKFEFPSPTCKLWVPAALNGPPFTKYYDAHFLRVLGRTNPGVTTTQVKAQMDLLSTRLDPEDNAGRHYYAVKLHEAINGELRRPLIVLFFAVAFLLAIAIANVANLMLARAAARAREMALRGALGASRWRLIRQLLTESTLLAFVGGALGCFLSLEGLRFITVYGSKSVPQLADVTLDVPALLFALIVSAGSGLLSGLAPALTACRSDFQSSLKDGLRSTEGTRANAARSSLVFLEIALTCALLVGCGLMIRSFISLSSVDPGFRPNGLTAAEIALGEKAYPDAANLVRFYTRTLTSLRALPGVRTAAMVTHLPFGGNSWGNSFEVEGQPAPQGHDYVAQIRPASPGYFAVMGIPLHGGREFLDADSENAPGVAIVNEVLAHRYWPTASPLGKRLRFDENWLTIVGICGNIKQAKLDSASEPEIYVPYPQLPPALMKFVGRGHTYVVRSEGAASPGQDVRQLLHSLDPNLVVQVKGMEHLIDDSIQQPRFRTWLITVFSFLALTLASLGIYGVMSFAVTQRVREIGLRIALGAQPNDIVRRVLRGALKLTLGAVAAGLVIAFALSRLLATLLFGIAAHDPVTYAGAASLLFVVALLASYIPAIRAARTDPMITLRVE